MFKSWSEGTDQPTIHFSRKTFIYRKTYIPPQRIFPWYTEKFLYHGSLQRIFPWYTKKFPYHGIPRETFHDIRINSYIMEAPLKSTLSQPSKYERPAVILPAWYIFRQSLPFKLSFPGLASRPASRSQSSWFSWAWRAGPASGFATYSMLCFSQFQESLHMSSMVFSAFQPRIFWAFDASA